MVERKIVIENMNIAYKGLFNIDEYFRLIDNWLRSKSYIKHEWRNSESVEATGKTIEIVNMPYKKITDYAKYIIQIQTEMDQVVETTIEKDGIKKNMNKGKIEVTLNGYLELDYEHRWEKKPSFYFLRTIFDQFIFKVHTDKFEQGLVEEVQHLHSFIKSHLNLYKY